MRVMQLTKRSVTLFAALSLALTACGGSGPDAPFNPAGTSEDVQAVNATFASPAFASFASFSPYFDLALGPAPLVSSSTKIFNFRRATNAGELRAAAARNAKRIAALTPKLANGSFSAATASIPAEVAGKTFEFNGDSYVPGDRTGAPANGVRFLLYAVNPITYAPVMPLQEVGYVQLTDLSGSTSQAARVVVVSEETTYLDYTVTATATVTGGRITVAGYVTDGTNRANVNLRSTVTQSTGLTLVYTLDVPQRDVSIDLTMTMTGLDVETFAIDIDLGMSGPNGTVSMSGQMTNTGGTMDVRVNGDLFATITSSGGSEPVITGADGQPLTDEDVTALQSLFGITDSAFTSFDEMLVPVGEFMVPDA